jgi:hypothetical protein
MMSAADDNLTKCSRHSRASFHNAATRKEPGAFVFFGNAHEPGDHTLLGKVYREGGMEQGEAALGDLARHPGTERHIALKSATSCRTTRRRAWSSGSQRYFTTVREISRLSLMLLSIRRRLGQRLSPRCARQRSFC